MEFSRNEIGRQKQVCRLRYLCQYLSGGIEVAEGKARIKDENVDCLESAAKTCPRDAILLEGGEKSEKKSTKTDRKINTDSRGSGRGKGLGRGPRDGRGKDRGGRRRGRQKNR